MGFRLHYVRGGHVPTLVLLAGWPQTWYAWRLVMPALAERFDVVAVAQTGLGDSDRPERGYDVHSAARALGVLLGGLGVERAHLAGHDVGAWIAFAYAAANPARVERLALLESAIPGVTPIGTNSDTEASSVRSWHFAFNQIPDLPETLVQGREREYLGWMFDHKSARPGVVAGRDLDVYAAAYAAPGAMTAGFAYYRALPLSRAEFKGRSVLRMPMAVLAVGAELSIG